MVGKPAPGKRKNEAFPGLKPSGASPVVASQYEERQRDEVEALEAIYGADFTMVKATHGAWKKSEPSFEIRISPDNDMAITLGVVLTATYPKSVPLLSLKSHANLSEATLFKIQKYIETEPKALASEEREMIQDLVEGIRDRLVDAAEAKAKGLKLPSLEEERAAHETMLAQMAQDEKDAAERKKQKEAEDKEQALAALVDMERERQRTKAKELRHKNKTNASPERSAEDSSTAEIPMVLDEPCQLTDSLGTMHFRTVTGKQLVASGPVSSVYRVRPIVSGDQDRGYLALKQVELRSTGKDAVQVLKQIQSLEPQLQTLKKLRIQKPHRNILEVLDFKVDRISSETASTSWTVSVLTLFSERGSLEDLLSLAHLDVGRVRAWTRDLLDALEYLHGQGILHQDIHPGNVLLFRERSGDIVPKLADAAYQRELHTIYTKAQSSTSMKAAKSAYWFAPEIAGDTKPQYTRKTDIWDFGVLFLQMSFGLDVPQKYRSPKELIESHSLSEPLEELVSKLFMADPKRRPRAFDLASSHFLATDAPLLDDDTSAVAGSLTSLPRVLPHRRRHDSMSRTQLSSRYQENFVEEGRLGRGGFGEVVKARKKLDGQIYAIKKITITQGSTESLTVTDILKEVRLLSQLSHPAVVRYYDAWLEEIPELLDTEGESSTEAPSTEYSDGGGGIDIEFSQSTGLDFMSSDNYPNIVFGSTDSSDEEEEEEEEGENDDEEVGSAAAIESDSDGDSTATASNVVTRGRTRRPSQRPTRTIMYISMEYCEKRTLRDLISKNLSKEIQETWRLFRQILEGLSHIHGLGIVHRDLKPENVFIGAGPDGVNNVKIGDFGLATTGQLATDKGQAQLDATDETRSVGTYMYVAPEVRSGGSGTYTAKVDLYSLGVILFEMSYPPMLAMQRAAVLTKLRGSPPVLPDDFKPKEKSQSELIVLLLNHNPKERPSASELLKSNLVPEQMQSETIRRALAGLSDSSSPYYHKMLSILFNKPVEQAKDYTWENPTSTPGSSELMRQHIVKETLISIFRRHGAVEVSRNSLYPKSALYNQSVVQLMDKNGTLLQLPFDLTMGNARALARNPNLTVVEASYSFGRIFRDRPGGGQPNMFGEVDFDLVTSDTLDLALLEAEAISVLDEIAAAFPMLQSRPLCFHVGHSDLLQLIFEFCGVEKTTRRAVADVLSRLNVHNVTWQKLKTDLRSPLVGASASSVDELERFDFRDTPSKAFSKLKSLFEGTDMYQRASSTLAHLKEVYEYAKKLGVSRKIYVCPLSTWNEAFFAGGIMFSCLVDRKVRDVFAAGGRYDGLIKEHRLKVGSQLPEERHAVGFSLNWEKLAQPSPKAGGKAFLKRAAEDDTQGLFSTKRCDVLVASFDAVTLRSTALELLRTLRDNEISAELARSVQSTDDLISRTRDDPYSWVVIIKQDMVKVKTLGKKDIPDVDMVQSQLLNWLKGEIRDRDTRPMIRYRSTNASELSNAAGKEHEQDVRVLVAQTKSKKFNRQSVVQEAQQAASKLVNSFLDGPIAAVETTDQVMELIRGTSLSDPESWRNVEQSVTTSERKYAQELHSMLESWRMGWKNSGGPRHAFVYNFRTGNCVYYDLGK